MSHALHLLAVNLDVQNRLRDEIKQAKQEHGGEDLGYEALIALPYLDAIFRETLRMYPPSAIVWRQYVLLTPIRKRGGSFEFPFASLEASRTPSCPCTDQ